MGRHDAHQYIKSPHLWTEGDRPKSVLKKKFYYKKISNPAPSYLITFMLSLGAVSIQWFLRNLVPGALFIFIYPTVFFLAWWIGPWPAILSSLFSILALLTIDIVARSENIYTRPESLGLAVFFLMFSIPVYSLISKGRQLEKTKKDTKERIIQAFLLSPSAHAVIKASDAKYSEVNEAFLKLTEYTQNEVIERTFIDLKLFESREKQTQIHDLILQQNSFRDFETRIDTKSGEHRWVEISGNCIEVTGEKYNLVIFVDVTQRKKIEDELRRTTTLLDATQLLAGIGAWEWDLTSNQWYFSKEWQKIHGTEKSQLTAEELMDLAYPEDRILIQKAFEDVRNGVKAYHIEHRIICPNTKEIRSVRASGQFVREPTTGRIVKIYGFVQDITERKEIESQVLLNEAKLKSVLDNAPVGIFGADQNGLLEYLNPAGRELWGDFKKVGPSEYSVYRGWNIDTNEPLKPGEWAMNRVLQTRKPVKPHRLRIENFEGKEKFIINAAGPVLGKKLELLGAVAITQDITDLVKAEKEVEKRNQQFQAIIDGASSTLVFMKDLEGHYIVINKYFEKLLGLSRDEIRGRTDYELFPEKTAEFFRQNDKRVISQLKTEQIEEPLNLAQEGELIFLSDKFPLFDHEGKPYALCGVSTDITERKKAEQSQLESEERLSLAVKNAHVGFYDWDVIKNRLIFSDQMVEDWDLPRGESLQDIQSIFALIHPADQKRVKRQIQKAIFKHLPYDIQFRILCTSGKIIWLDVHGMVNYDSEERPVRFFGTSLNITHRKEAEEAVQFSLQRLRATFDHVGVGILEAEGPHDVIINANDRIVEILGYSTHDQIIGKTVSELTAPEDQSISFQMNHEIHSSVKNRISYEKRYIRATGESVWVNVTLTAIHDSLGRYKRTITTIEDISARKKAEENLKESEARFRTYTEAMPQGAFIADPDGNILYYNKHFYDYIGASGGIEGWEWKNAQLIHPEDLKRTISAWSHSIQTGEPYEIVYRLRRGDGQYRWNIGKAIPLHDQTGSITQWIGTNTDIHETKEIQEKLQQALRSRDEFISIASHELKTPITSLKLQYQLLKRKFRKINPALIKNLNLENALLRAIDQLDRLTDLIEEMLDVSQIENGSLEIKKTPNNLSNTVKEVTLRFESEFSKKQMLLIINIEKEIQGNFDRYRIEQVVTNLLSNALKYGAVGKPVEIQLFRKTGALVELSIRDYGIGISNTDQNRIFEQFERAITARKISGLGLGLYIVRQIIDLHGGNILVTSQLGEGAKFVVELPIQAQREGSSNEAA